MLADRIHDSWVFRAYTFFTGAMLPMLWFMVAQIRYQ